jgi:hypothetical protein
MSTIYYLNAIKKSIKEKYSLPSPKNYWESSQLEIFLIQIKDISANALNLLKNLDENY